MVRVSDRNPSAVQYVDDARKIADQVTERMQRLLDKLAKKYMRFKYIANRVNGYFYEAPVRYATDAYLALTYANRIYIKDEKDLKRREKQLKAAIEDYNKLQSVLSIVFGKFGKMFNMNAVSNLVDFINSEVEQIKKIAQSDKNVLNSKAD